MKTTKQIADDIGVSKQRIYRYIKKHHIKESQQENGVMYYDDVAENLIKQAFSEMDEHQGSTSEAHQEHINDTLIDILREELERKDKQISELQKIIVKQQNTIDELNGTIRGALENTTKNQLAETIVEGKLLLDGDGSSSKKWWQFWK